VTRSIPTLKASLAIPELSPFGTVMRTSCMAHHKTVPQSKAHVRGLIPWCTVKWGSMLDSRA
jgi:hypothetical protein